MPKLIDILNGIEDKAIAGGMAFAAYRTVPMIGAEMAAGMSFENSALARTGAFGFNFIGALIYEEGREIFQNIFRIGKSNGNGKKAKKIDRLYGPGFALIDLGFMTTFYHFVDGGIKKETAIPIMMNYFITNAGNLTGHMVDTWMDGMGVRKENSRSWFYANTSKKEKESIIGAANILSVAMLANYVQQSSLLN